MHYIVKGIATATQPVWKKSDSQSRIMGSKSQIFSSMVSMANSIRASVNRKMSTSWSTGLGSTKELMRCFAFGPKTKKYKPKSRIKASNPDF